MVLVRSENGTQAPSAPATPEQGSGGIVLGLDIHHPCDPLVAFAFGEAARRGETLHVLHSWALPASYGYAAITDPDIGVELGRHASEGLAELLRPWRPRFPGVQVTERAVAGVAAGELLQAARGGEPGHRGASAAPPPAGTSSRPCRPRGDPPQRSTGGRRPLRVTAQQRVPGCAVSRQPEDTRLSAGAACPAWPSTRTTADHVPTPSVREGLSGLVAGRHTLPVSARTRPGAHPRSRRHVRWPRRGGCHAAAPW